MEHIKPLMEEESESSSWNWFSSDGIHQQPFQPRLTSADGDNCFAMFTDEILGFVFFSSGYISQYWPNLLTVLLVSKRFCAVGKRFIRAVSTEANQSMGGDWVCYVLPQMAENIIELRLDYSFQEQTPAAIVDKSNAETAAIQSLFPSKSIRNLCVKLFGTLESLSLRGTTCDDEALQSISMLTNLTYLDISKSKRVHADKISDTGMLRVAESLNLLVWLNLSMTRITDKTIARLSQSLTSLKHLGLQCCSLLTDQCFSSLEAMSLVTLDVSSCIELTNDAFFVLGNKKAVCRQTLTNLFASHLPLCTLDLLGFFLVKFENLRVLDFRVPGSLQDPSKLPSPDHIALAKSKLRTAAFQASDRHMEEPSMYMQSVMGQRAYER